MSGIYIPGMEMPTIPKPLNQGDEIPYIDVRIFADGSAVVSKGEKPYFTEYSAVPVPEHGRLIDADALMEIARYKGPHDIVTAWDIVDAPTIIPADKEETE